MLTAPRAEQRGAGGAAPRRERRPAPSPLHQRVHALLPEGGQLPRDVWQRRHHGILAVLWAHVPAVTAFALVRGESLAHSLFEAGLIALFAVLATARIRHRELSTVATAMGLLTASAVLVHLSHGTIEMHFHYFVIVGVVTLYQEWKPFLLAIAYVVLQHGVMGAIAPESVYNHPGGLEDPWTWALVHGGFILAMSVAGITAWRLNESLLRDVRDRQARLTEAQQLALMGSWEWDLETDAVTWSAEQHRLLGLAPGVAPGRSLFAERVHPGDRAALNTLVSAIRRTGEPFSLDFRIVLPGGEERWLHGRGGVSRWSGDQPVALTGTCQDVTDRHASEERLRHALSLLEASLDSTADGILVVGSDGRVTDHNAQFAAMWRIPQDMLDARDDGEMLRFVIGQLDDPDGFVAKVQELYANPDLESHDILTFTDGRVFERYSKPQRVGGRTVGRVWSFRDVTERKRLETELTHQAFHDSLTGLANQMLFRDRVEHALARSARSNEELAVLFVDLDNFKTVNDSLGHSVGDELLEAVAERVRSCVRVSDTAARLGGDEFAVLLEGVDAAAEAPILARRILDAVARPLAAGGRDIVLGASVGIAFTGPDVSTVDELLRNADMAMYKAKSAGRGRFERFEPSMHTAALERLHVEADLRRAVTRGEIVVHYQPVVRVDTGAVVAVEALVRWQHPTRGMLPPDSFIPVAEQSGQIRAIGQHVLDTACRATREWQQRHPRHAELRVSVNLAPQELHDPDLAPQIAAALEASGLDPGHLVLEITEGAMVQEEALATLSRLKDLGVLLAIDDFGTGYASLSYLQRFRVDLLKIDRAFIGGATDVESAALPRAIVHMARALSLAAVAEGVETAEQAERLRSWGCEYAQGYHFARPLDAAALDAYLAEAAAGEVVRQPAV